MKTLKSHIKDSLKNGGFRKYFEEEKELLRVSLQLQKAREHAGLSQKEIAEAAHVTQQQVSKVENGTNCNILTYLKVSRAIGLTFGICRPKHSAAA
jgi:HTH-type transcriptional regulator / antitoxin HipB